VIQHLTDTDHVAVLGVYVVEVRLVGVRVAIPHGLAGYDGPKAVLEGVDGRSSYAVPKKPEANNLLRTGSVSRGAMRGSICAQRVPACRVRSAGTFSIKAAAVSLSDSL
jgi:hypothetical protein